MINYIEHIENEKIISVEEYISWNICIWYDSFHSIYVPINFSS